MWNWKFVAVKIPDEVMKNKVRITKMRDKWNKNDTSGDDSSSTVSILHTN